VTQYQKHTTPYGGDNSLVSSPPLPPRNYIPFSRSPTDHSYAVSGTPPLPPRTYISSKKQEQLLNSIPPPASASGFPVPVPRTSLKKLVTSPGPLHDMEMASDTFQPPPPQRSSSWTVFSETSHYSTLAEVAAGTGPHCRLGCLLCYF